MKRTSTYFPKSGEISDNWRVFDAEGQTLGRLARNVAVALQGKDKPTYTPHVITGDHVVIVNAEKIKVTGNKLLDKLYYKGAKRYPSQDKLRKAIDKLTEAVTKNPKGTNAAKQKFFIAQCYEKIGQDLQANDYYNQVASEHPNSRFANKAREHLSTNSTTK